MCEREREIFTGVHYCTQIRMIQFCTDGFLVFSILIIMSVVKCETKEVLSFTANKGGKVDIQCPYESRYETNDKYLCKGMCPNIPFLKDIPVKSGAEPNDRRFNLTDNSTANIFTVTITDLRPSDEGKYWCAIVTGSGRTDDYKEVYLKIQHDNGGLLTVITTTTKTTTISSMSPVSYHYTVNTQTVASSSPSSTSVCIVSENSDLATMISLSVTVILLLLFGLSLFMFYRQRNKKKNHDSSQINSNTLQESVENNIYVIQTVFEGPHDVKNHSDCCTCSSCVNGNSNILTNPSETINTVYATVQLPRKPLA
nr:CMRF35-like molecule 8 [Misgurnus anguillicaudatus]